VPAQHKFDWTLGKEFAMSAYVKMLFGILFGGLLLAGCRTKVTEPTFIPNNTPTTQAGMIPLTVGNWWEYSVQLYDSALTAYSFRRMVRAKHQVDNDDYYLLVDSMLEGGRLDTFCYMRWNKDAGIIVLPCPADSGVHGDTLFMYPHVRAGTRYWFQQDSVIVLYDPPGGHEMIGDSLCTVMAYQRFVRGDRNTSYIYDLIPDSIGVIRGSFNGVNSYVYALVNYHVMR
jgi:hypothetical protein